MIPTGRITTTTGELMNTTGMARSPSSLVTDARCPEQNGPPRSAAGSSGPSGDAPWGVSRGRRHHLGHLAEPVRRAHPPGQAESFDNLSVSNRSCKLEARGGGVG